MLKDVLQFDPLIDVQLNRLPDHFVSAWFGSEGDQGFGPRCAGPRRCAASCSRGRAGRNGL